MNKKKAKPKYDFKIEVVNIHLTTMFKLLVVLFIMSKVIFFTSLIYFSCSEYIISELLFCFKRIEFEQISVSQDTSTKVKRSDLSKIILTKSFSADRLYGM